MRNILGKYRDIDFRYIQKFGEISPLYEDFLSDIYNQNKRVIPMDILAAMLEIISYPKWVKNYVEQAEAESLEYGEARKLMSKEILDASFSRNILDGMIKYNIVPYRLDDYRVELLTPEIDAVDFDEPTFIMFRTSLIESLGDVTKEVIIRRGSNKLFMDALYILQGLDPYSLNDIEITSKQLFQKIAIDAIIRQATDIYIDPKQDRINIYLSIFNEKVPHTTLIMNRIQTRNFVNAIIEECGEAADKIDWAAEGGRKDYKMLDLGKFDGRYEGRVNVTITPLEGIVSPVIRIHDTNRTMQPMEQLKITPEAKTELKNILRNQNGLFIIAGGTGQGKSTTLYSCIDHLMKYRAQDRIEEMSDPIEMQIDGISQLKLDMDKGLDWAGLSQSTTRRNPKILFLGEINSPGSAEFAVDQAIKDLFVMSTTHAGSTSLILPRIQGLTLREPFLYNEFLNLVKGLAHQKMLKEKCPHCSKKIPTSNLGAVDKEILAAYGFTDEEVWVERPDPDCEICNGIGYLVDKPAVCIEILAVTDDIRERIILNKENPQLEVDRILRENEMAGINDALRYLRKGIITYDMLYRRYELYNINKQLILDTKKG